MTWPVRSGEVPPLADSHSPRPETGGGLVANMGPGETVVLIPAGEPGEHGPGKHSHTKHSPSTSTGSTGSTAGTGKTQLAVALARTLWETRAVDLLVWVTAISRDAIVTAYAQASADIQAADQDDDPETAAARFLAWLAETSRPWLVVLDDLADPADVTGLWPQGPAGRVLVTTQRRDDTLREPGRRMVPVGPFTLREALAYLTARLHDDPGQRTEALDLATDLGCHPLALAQATALMTDTGVNCREYRLWFTDRRRQLAGAAPGDPPSTLEVTWSLSIERASQLPPADLAGPALALIAVMDPSGVPGAVLLSHAACSYITGRYATAADQAQVRDTVNNLHRLDLVTVNPASAPRTAMVHADVQALVLENLAPAALARAARAAADALLESWPQRDTEQPLLAQALRDSTVVLNGTAAELLWAPQAHDVLIRAGQSLDAVRLRGAATAYWRDMSAVCTKRLGPGHAQTLRICDQLAAAEGTAGQLGPDDAIALFQRTLADREWALGAGHPDTLAAREDLARAYGRAGRLVDALPLYELTLADWERSQGARHPATLTACGNLANAYQQAGLAKEAIPLYERILAGRERSQGRDHPDTLTARGHLAYAYRSAGRLKNAIPQYERTVAGRERVLGADHPDTLTARGNLANAYCMARRRTDAVAVFQRTLADCERALGPDHPLTQTVRENLAAVGQR
jgi:tetratricopeptide (TPR) repeat protein